MGNSSARSSHGTGTDGDAAPGAAPGVVVPAGMRPAWRQHRLTVAGPADMLADFAAAARGPGVVPWHIDGAALEEDLFNLAVTRPGRGRGLGVGRSEH